MQPIRHIQRWGWVLWILGITFTLALGTMGFHLHFRSIPGCVGATWLDCIYAAVRLFALEFDGSWDGSKPLMLELARFVAPVLLAVGAVRVALAIFRAQADTFRTRFMKRHTVVCGAGEKGAHLVRDLIGRGQRVVVVERDVSCDSLTALRQMGAICVAGDGGDCRTLRMAGMERAASIVALAGNDEANLAIALAAAKMAEKRHPRDGQLVVACHIADPILRDLLQRNCVLAPPGDSPAVIRTFNHFQTAARMTFQEHPLEILDDGKSLATEVHLVLPDLGGREQALMLQAARIGHFRNGKRINLHVIAPDASAKLKHLKSHYPNLSLCCNLAAEEAPRESDFVALVARLGLSLPADGAMTVFTRKGDDQNALVVTLQLAESLRAMKGRLRICLETQFDSPLVDLIQQNSSLNTLVTVLLDNRTASGWNAVFGEEQDRLARAIHEAWYRAESQRLANTPSAVKKPTFKPWEDLTEEQKDSSRAQADFIPVKLRAVGLTTDTARIGWPSIVDDKETLEALAQMEHARWCANNWLAGWTYAAHRSDANKTHNHLVPYSELDDHTKQYDRDTILNLQDYLAL